MAAARALAALVALAAAGASAGQPAPGPPAEGGVPSTSGAAAGIKVEDTTGSPAPDKGKLAGAFKAAAAAKKKAAEAAKGIKDAMGKLPTAKAFPKLEGLKDKLSKIPPKPAPKTLEGKGKFPPKNLAKQAMDPGGRAGRGPAEARRRMPPDAAKAKRGFPPNPKKPFPKKLDPKALNSFKRELSAKRKGLPKTPKPFSSRFGGPKEEKDATVVFTNEAEGAEDIEIYWMKPPQSPWPPIPARNSADAVQVSCRIGRRRGKSVKSVAELKQDLEIRGEFNITVRKDWAPIGAQHYLKLVEDKFFDGSCLFRAVKDFLTQFGVSPDSELQQKHSKAKMKDDPPRPELLPLRRGTLAYAGSGADSRTTQLWLSFKDGVAGNQPWETPVGYVQPRHGLEVLDLINTEYGDLAAFNGGAPDPALIEKEDGLDYLLKGWPNIDYFESCQVVGQAEEERPQKQTRETVLVGTVKAGEQLTQSTKTGHMFQAKTGGPDGKVLKSVMVRQTSEVVQLTSSSKEL